MPVYQLREIQQNTEELLTQLEAEIRECSEVGSCYANKVKKFMAANGIWHLKELDYYWREVFEEFLSHEVKPSSYRKYIKAFDRLKQHSVQAELRLIGRQGLIRPKFDNQMLFLLYHPNPDVVRKYNDSTKKKDLLWDFSVSAPEQMKRQIFRTLHRILESEDGYEINRIRLIELKKIYDYCIKKKVTDIEKLELKKKKKIKRVLQNEPVLKKEIDIIDYIRETLFLESKEIRWNVNVWYMKRFHLQKERLNAANPVKRISFLEVSNQKNRELLKKYIRYNLGLTDLSVSSICNEFRYVRNFLTNLQPDKDVCTLTNQQINWNLLKVEKKSIKAESYNDIILSILHFFQFLRAHEYILEIPFQKDYYLKKEIAQHHDRSIENDIQLQLLRNLHRFPEELRLMYLHLWTLGLRISEVCTLKGDAYYLRGRDAWIKIYQIKLRTFKKIPIPDALYQLMQIYIQRKGIRPDEYVFQNQKGGAFRSGTFRKKMLDCCTAYGIQNGEYIFRSHDFRHGVATQLYNNGTSLQSVRDYLGHEYDEMTLQYVDYMPKRLDKENETFFDLPGNSLAGYLKEGKK